MHFEQTRAKDDGGAAGAGVGSKTVEFHRGKKVKVSSDPFFFLYRYSSSWN